uniref:Uncharacterized protein n=1 Tax=Kwoniella dejecticola CBS 10117 TaxID=1296121 RepID=A0A1A6A473_9TREE|nr:uncharacterized protein I303_04177 [Kwoniella dejecticola CBS 10117]OBR84856.1 hypothetical protein I303_04177 [Kwoniella dejecticola CBS 10117]
MNEPMDIDLSLDEIIAKKRAQERVDNRTERRSQTTPYNRPPRAPRAFSRNENDDASPGGGQGQGLKNSLSFSDIKQRYTDPSFPSFSSAPLQPTTENLNRPCRELSVGLFTKDITPLQIRDLIQSTVGPVQELRLDSKGIAWVRMLRWQGWEFTERFLMDLNDSKSEYIPYEKFHRGLWHLKRAIEEGLDEERKVKLE